MARRFANTCSVCSPIVPPMSSVWPGSRATWPETNTSPPADDRLRVRRALKRRRGCLRANDVLAHIVISLPVVCAARAGQRGAQRLEDRVEHVLRVVAFQQANVQRQAGAAGEALQEVADHVGREPADVR